MLLTSALSNPFIFQPSCLRRKLPYHYIISCLPSNASISSSDVILNMNRTVPLSKSNPFISSKGWTLASLVGMADNFCEVPRESAFKPELQSIIAKYDCGGVPLIIDGWHKHPHWLPSFNIDWFQTNGQQSKVSLHFTWQLVLSRLQQPSVLVMCTVGTTKICQQKSLLLSRAQWRHSQPQTVRVFLFSPWIHHRGEDVGLE